MPKRKGLVVAVLMAIAMLAPAANAQPYPTRPITLIVPFPPGGSTSVMARIVAERMSATIGQQIVVDNRGGAGGTIAARAFVHAPPDGYTIFLGYSGTISIAPSMYPNVGFDPRKDFAPIGMIGSAPAVLVVHPSFQPRTAAELIALAKAKPGEINFGSAGIGTLTHIAAELFISMAKIKLLHIPYKGSGPVLADLLGGHIPMSFTPIPVAHSHVAAGTLRALAVTSVKRSTLLPEVPTVAETGLPGYEAVLHYGLLAPAATPRPLIDKLNKELRAALDSDEVRKRMATEGAEPLPSTPEEYAADIDQEEKKWSRVVKEAGIKPD
ncbi:MAG: tripartite tricarboxylate transporter substrate binding protein, partial [Xanthobacteraceae bacterium]|nr:tripartite tricarboxylate transporter substrate binding protein [Xanthobacteraceae bacterium]